MDYDGNWHTGNHSSILVRDVLDLCVDIHNSWYSIEVIKEHTMREPLAMFYFMFPVLIPAVIALGWGIVMTIRDQLRDVQ